MAKAPVKIPDEDREPPVGKIALGDALAAQCEKNQEEKKNEVEHVKGNRSEQQNNNLSVRYNFGFECPFCGNGHVLSSNLPNADDLVAVDAPCGKGRVTVDP